MVTIYYRSNLISLVIDGKAVERNCLMIDDYQRHSMLAIPIDNCDIRLPVCGSIQADSLRHISLSNNYDYIDLGNGDYELLPLFPELPRGYRPQVVMQREAEGILATLYQDYGRQLLIEDEYSFVNHAITEEIEDINIGYCESGGLIIVYGANYLAVFLRDSEDFRLLLEKIGGKPTFNADSIDIRYSRQDMRGRIVTESYSLRSGKYDLLSRKYEYTVRHKYISELMPCLLIDALIAEDYEFARSLLAPDLAQNIFAIRDFFGEIISFYSIKGQPIGDKSLYLLVNDNGKKCVKKYLFEYDNTHIINFSEADN